MVRNQGRQEGKRWPFTVAMFTLSNLPLCHDRTVSGFWAESLLGCAVLIEVPEHLYCVIDTFLSYAERETL